MVMGHVDSPTLRHMKVRQALQVSLAAVVWIGFLILPGLSFGQGTISLDTHGVVFVNDSVKPSLVTKLTDSEKKHYADIFVMGRAKMAMSDKGWPMSGAGFIQTLNGRTYNVIFAKLDSKEKGTPKGRVVFLWVKKIQWDDSGKTISVDGLLPQVGYTDGQDISEMIKVTSDVTKPKIVDGVLYLKLAGKADREYGFDASYGRGKSISPDWNLTN
jgi:hypothetical protein